MSSRVISELVRQIIDKGSTKDLYRYFCIIKNESEKTKEAYEKVRYGINFIFDINDFFGGKFCVKQKQRLVIIGGNVDSLDLFYTEVEERESLMRRHLIESAELPEILKPVEA
ncbi:MAG: hypothetical protein VXZ40_04240 [Nanoarchaeota archaeon]|nr:hypothetical protein [Nanoarchaeota archaeon]